MQAWFRMPHWMPHWPLCCPWTPLGFWSSSTPSWRATWPGSRDLPSTMTSTRSLEETPRSDHLVFIHQLSLSLLLWPWKWSWQETQAIQVLSHSLCLVWWNLFCSVCPVTQTITAGIVYLHVYMSLQMKGVSFGDISIGFILLAFKLLI